MPTTMPSWAWPVGSAVLFFALRYLWPLMRQSLDTQLTQGRTESGLLRQALEERDKAVYRADAAEERADKLFAELSGLKAQIQIMQFKLDQAQTQVAHLSEQIAKLTGETR